MGRYEIVGRKRWKGTVVDKQTGRSSDIDSGKLFARVKLDSSRNGKRDGSDAFADGFAVEEIRLPDGELVRRIEHLPLPLFVDIDTERVSNGKTARDVVIDVRPVVDQVLQPGGASPVVKPVQRVA